MGLFDRASSGAFSLTARLAGKGAKALGGVVANAAIGAIVKNKAPQVLEYPSLPKGIPPGGTWSGEEFDDTGKMRLAIYTVSGGKRYHWSRERRLSPWQEMR